MADASDGQVGGSGFEPLIAAMPRMAKAVNAFPEGVQQSAFEALMAAFHEGAAAPSRTRPTTDDQLKPPKRTSARRSRKLKPTKDGNGESAPRRASTGTTLLKELDLTPKGKQTFKAFVAEKQPQSQHDKNLVSVYYLLEIAGIDKVSMDHVFTCYRDSRWPLPKSGIAVSMRLTANKTRWLDTADSFGITITPAGHNRIEQELPIKKSEK